MIIDKIDSRPCWGKGAEIILHTPDMDAVKALMDKYTEGKTYVAEIKEKRARRSLDANAYCWVLIGKLAENRNLKKTEVYREYIKEMTAYEVVPIKIEAVEKWISNWEQKGLGWLCDDMGDCRNTKGYKNIKCYFGSSTFDTREMSHFIDMIVTDCHELGIETATPDELARLKQTWGGD